MASDIGICNSALSRIGDFAIASLTDTSKAAKLCNLKYADSRDAIFRSYPWNCLQRRAALARSSDTPEWGYDYKYQLPTDPYCLKVLGMKEQDEDSSVDFVVEGRYILTDSETCNIRYVGRILDANQYDVNLQDAIAAKLAADICYPLTGSATLTDVMYRNYMATVKQARSVDAQEGTPRTLIDDTWLNSRQ
jgi:hypothetical protein